MITLRFTTSGSLISKAIRLFSWSKISHTEILVPGKGWLGAHLGSGVKIRDFDYDKKATFIQLGDVYIDEEKTAAVLDFAMKQIGKPYDLRGIFGFLFHSDMGENEKFFCSELVAAAFDYANYPLINRIEPEDRITPRDIYLSPLVNLRPVDC